MRLPRFEFRRPQQLASLLLLCFVGQCLWVVNRQTISENDYQVARCGREMWERPFPLPGYFTTCGNIHDGTFAYRAAALPLTVQFLSGKALDQLRKPEDRVFTGEDASASPYELRHQLSHILLLMRLPFIGFGVWLGGGLWWVTRRLFGNPAAALALALYCFSPPVIAAACLAPSNDLLAMWGLYGIIYTAIGVAHAMQGPRKKWRPRILLLALALGLTACAHIAAALLGFGLALLLMFYLGERRRGAVLQVLPLIALGAALVLFASYAFRPSAFDLVLRSGVARLWFSVRPLVLFVTDLRNAGEVTAAAVAFVFYLAFRRSGYFGNTVPLFTFLLLAVLITTGIVASPLLWGLPFLFTFIAGVFADLLETNQRRVFAALAIALACTQAALSLASLHLVA